MTTIIVLGISMINKFTNLEIKEKIQLLEKNLQPLLCNVTLFLMSMSVEIRLTFLIPLLLCSINTVMHT